MESFTSKFQGRFLEEEIMPILCKLYQLREEVAKFSYLSYKGTKAISKKNDRPICLMNIHPKSLTI